MPDADVYKISAGITTGISAITFLGTLYFNGIAKREERSLQTIIGEEPVSAVEIRNILRHFKDDASRLKALEMLLGERSKHAAGLYQKIRDNVDINRLAQSQARTNFSMARATTIVVFVLAGTLWTLGFQGNGNAHAVSNPPNPSPNATTNRAMTNSPNVAPMPPQDWDQPQWKVSRGNIDWVFGDQGAHEKYLSHLNQGKFDALLYAQSGNKGAYQSISEFGRERTELYLKSKGW